MQVPASLAQRPFSVERTTGIMLPDGIFDSALPNQTINSFIKSDSDQALQDVQVYLEGLSDGGISYRSATHIFASLLPGSSVRCWWDGDFRNAIPGKPTLSIIVMAKGFDAKRILGQLFVSRTRYDQSKRVYTCEIPEGLLVFQTVAMRGRPYQENDKDRVGPWLPRILSLTVESPFQGQLGPLPFQDPWWKIVGFIVAAIAALAAVILARDNQGTAKVQVKCDYDEKAGGFTNCDTPRPAPTTGPSEMSPASIASAIASTALSIGFADAIDPWRRGQLATAQVGSSERTISETVQSTFDFPDGSLEAGKPSRVFVDWMYTRVTDRGSYHHAVTETVANTHLCTGRRVRAPATVKVKQDRFIITASFTKADGSLFIGHELFVTAFCLAPDGSEFAVVLTDGELTLGGHLTGMYVGELNLDSAIHAITEHHGAYLGVWRINVLAQDVNNSPAGAKPEDAARVIGGFVVASPIVVTTSSGACPVAPPDALVSVVV